MFFKSYVTKYFDFTKANVSTLTKQAPTPYLPDDDKDCDESKEPQGQFQSIAARVIMKILCGARMARYDLLHVRHVLACKITKWTKRCDQRPHRITCYLHQVDDITMMGWVGDTSVSWNKWLFTDADFAADKTTSRSMSGRLCAINGPTTYFPLRALCKKQSAVSHSTAESEMTAADLGLRTEALPMRTVFDQALKRQIRCLFLERIKQH